MRAAVLLLIALPSTSSILLPHSGVRPHAVAPSATPAEPHALLLDIRRSIHKVRQLRQQAMATSAMIEADGYEKSLAELDDIRRAALRSATAGMLREKRSAERRFRDWRKLHTATFVDGDAEYGV